MHDSGVVDDMQLRMRCVLEKLVLRAFDQGRTSAVAMLAPLAMFSGSVGAYRCCWSEVMLLGVHLNVMLVTF